MKIKKGDTVIVNTGKDRGKEGVVLRVFPKQDKVLVEGVSIVHRHQKAKRRGSQGQVVEKPMPIPVSNVNIKHPKTGKPARIGYTTVGDGEKAKKVRIVRPTGEKI